MVNPSYVSEVAGLIQRMERLIRDSRRLPLTGRVLVDEGEFLTLLQQLQHALPDEVRHAHLILAERERLLAEAKAEADRMQEEGRTARDRLAYSAAVTEASRERAQAIVTQAEELAKEIHQGSRNYADEILAHLEDRLEAILKTIRADRADLKP